MDIGAPELLIILLIVVVIFGVGRVGKLGGELGGAIRGFRRGLNGDSEKIAAETKAAADTSAAAAVAVEPPAADTSADPT